MKSKYNVRLIAWCDEQWLSRKRVSPDITRLILLLDHQDDHVVAAAADNIGHLGNRCRSAWPKLLCLLLDTKKPAWLRDTCAYALGRIDSRRIEVVKGLSMVAREHNGNVSRCAREALKRVYIPRKGAKRMSIINMSKRSSKEKPHLNQARINRAWSAFKAAGMLWFVNRLLHFFGWAIVFRYEDKTGKLLGVEPNRCRFRGFSQEVEDHGYHTVTKWMSEHAKEFMEDVNITNDLMKKKHQHWLRLPR